MFARHDIVALGQRSRDVLQKCSECGVLGWYPGLWLRADAAPLTTALLSAALHAEPYIMFSTDKKSLLCIRCFRDMQGWVEAAASEGAGGRPEAGLIRSSPQGEPGPLRGPRVSLRAGLRAAGAGGAGERGVPGGRVWGRATPRG